MIALTPRRLAAAALAVGCAGVVAACGSSDSSSGDTAAGCKADFAVNTGFDQLQSSTPALQGGKPLTSAQLTQFQANYDKLVAGPLADLQKNAPDEISSEVDSVVGTAKQFRATSDAKPLQSPAVHAKTTKIDK